MAGPRTLVIDIETAPHLVHAWGLYDVNVALNQVVRPGYVLCFAAKWMGARDITFARVEHDVETGEPTPESRLAMLQAAHRLLSEADVIVTYNGRKFDTPRLNAEFMEFGFAPPAPYIEVDCLAALKRRSRFASHKLAYVAERLGVGRKVKHAGHGLWRDVMADDEDAWVKMQVYNEGDVRLTQRFYKRILPWIENHPNVGLYGDTTRPCCPNCGANRPVRQGVRRARTRTYVRYQCAKCGAWSRGKRAIDTTEVQGA